MATDTVDGMSSHMRGLTVTTLAAVAGLAASVATNAITGGDPRSQVAVAVVALAVLVQFPILHVMGIEYDGLSTKDKVFIGFMTFALWFVSWGILLSAAG